MNEKQLSKYLSKEEIRYVKNLAKKIDKRYGDKMPETGNEITPFIALGVSDNMIAKLLKAFVVPDIVSKQLSFAIDWQIYRYLLNVLIGYSRNYANIYNCDMYIVMSMHKFKKDWQEAYSAKSLDKLYDVIVKINDDIQRRHGNGVWYGDIRIRNLYDASESRHLFHPDDKYAFEYEFYAVLKGDIC